MKIFWRLEGVEVDVLGGKGLLVFDVELSASLGLADRNPVDGFWAAPTYRPASIPA